MQDFSKALAAIESEIAEDGYADVGIVTDEGDEMFAKVFRVTDSELFGKVYGGCEFSLSVAEVVSLEVSR